MDRFKDLDPVSYTYFARSSPPHKGGKGSKTLAGFSGWEDDMSMLTL